MRSPYLCVRKADEDGTVKLFTPLRAVGLSVEEGRRVARRVGFGRLTTDLCSRVKVSGDSLEICVDGEWRHVGQHTLSLLKQDAELAWQVVVLHRAFL